MLTRSTLRHVFSALSGVAVILAAFVAPPDARGQNTLSYNFETAGQWTGNFRSLLSIGSGTAAQTTVSSNGLFRLDSTGGNQAAVYLLDQTPTDTTTGTDSGFALATGDTVTVAFDARTSANGSSFSVLFINPANFADNLLAILNINGAGTVDQIRFFRDVNTGTASLGGTQMGGGNFNVGVDGGATSFVRLSVTLSFSGTTPTLSATCGTQTTPVTSTFASGDFTWTSRTLLAIRLYDNNTAASSADLDNLSITSPSAPDNPPPPNVAPVLPSQSTRSVAPYETLSVNNAATDANTPAQTLTYELLAPPAGATIHPATGLITWMPVESQQNTAFTLTTRVTDSGDPALSAENSFTVNVTAYVPQANVAPVLPTQPDRTLAVGNLITPGTLSVNNAATDSNLPAQTLTYELLSPPAGATINSVGLITWTPSAGQASPTPYTLTTRVTDSGDPALSAQNSFQVTVNPPAPLGTYIQSFDFASAGPGAFETRFRPVVFLGGGTAGQNAADRLVVNATSNGGNTSAAFLFDTTPADLTHSTQSSFPHTEPLTVSYLVRAAANDSTIAVVFADPQNAGNHVAALFNVKTGDDTVRFFRDGSFTARSVSGGTQVGSTANLATPAEPGSADYLRVTVSLSVSGTTPTLTVRVGDLDPVVSAFAAGDLDWVRSLLLLRVSDPSTTSATAIEFASVLVGGAAPLAPPAPVLPPAAGPDGNLITVNPGFESGSLNNFSGSYSFTGWTGSNALFSYHGFNSGSVAAGTTTEGTRALRQSWGGTLATAVLSRPPAIPGATYELRHDQRSLVRNFPDEKLGTLRFLEFFDAAGIRLKQAFGTRNDYFVQYDGPNATGVWETFALRAVAPAGAAYVGVRLEAPSGRFASNEENFTQDRHVEFDNIRLALVPEAADRLSWRRLPRLVEPGRPVALRIQHSTTGPRLLRASLLDASGAPRASAQTAVAAAGRSLDTPLSVAIPADLPNGAYSWRLELLPASGFGPAVATRDQPGVVCDQSVALSTINTTDFRADHPRIQYMGRIEEQPSGSRRLHWFGSEMRVRFSGTSLTLVGATSDNGFGGYTDPWSFTVVVDGDLANPISVTMSPTSSTVTKTLVSGLPDGIHTVRLLKPVESIYRLRVDTLRTDPGRGLLLPEPASPRKLEVFGDSVTSGSSANPKYYAYAPYLGAFLDAQVHIVSVSGTGVASSFSGQSLLGQYYDNLELPNGFSGNGGTPWDFSRYTPDVAVIMIGHNDQFNNGAGTPFRTKYAEFKDLLRGHYPGVKILSGNTTISANYGHFRGALDPLVATDPDHRFAFQPNPWSDSNTIHPPTDSHIAMITGDERRYSMAEVVEELAGWGLDTPPSGYEQWASAHFTAEQLAAGQHAPAAAPAGDGVPNLLRYALGATPAGPVTLPAADTTLDGKLSLTFNRAEDDALYIVETSTDLLTWSQASINPGAVGEQVTWTDSTPATPRRFVRLRVISP